MSLAGYDTLILSDLHLGSELSRARDARHMLEDNCFRRLILLGDIFSDLNFRRLSKEHWKFLGSIRKLSNPKRGIEVIWVEGNHDKGLSDIMSHLVGIRVYQEYSWVYGGLRHLAIHGHQAQAAFAIRGPLQYALAAPVLESRGRSIGACTPAPCGSHLLWPHPCGGGARI
jgi:metallophosphoesterase superfamily enzyme